jgi:hypothetical protein
MVDPITNLPTTRHHLQQRIPGSQRFTHFGVRGPKGLVTGRPRPGILMVSSWLLHVACDFGNLLHHVVVLCCFLLTVCIPFFHLEHPCGFNLTSLCPKRNHMVSLNMVELLLNHPKMPILDC